MSQNKSNSNTYTTTDVNCITAAFFPTVAYPKRAKQHVPHAAIAAAAFE